MAKPALQTLHVMFNVSAAGSLRQALAAAGRSERVVALPDDLSFGPIDPQDPLTRARWMESELDYNWLDDLTDWSKQINAFWEEALNPELRLVAWNSRRSAPDHCGFLEWLWRLGNRPCDVINVSDFTIPEYQLQDGRLAPSRLAVTTGSIPPLQIVAANLFDLVEAPSLTARASYQREWENLRTENTALRIIRDGELRSAPLSYFDEALLSHVKPEWRKAARVVGEVLSDDWKKDVWQSGDLVLWARVRALAAAGRVEHRGDLTRMRSTEIRRI